MNRKHLAIAGLFLGIISLFLVVYLRPDVDPSTEIEQETADLREDEDSTEESLPDVSKEEPPKVEAPQVKKVTKPKRQKVEESSSKDAIAAEQREGRKAVEIENYLETSGTAAEFMQLDAMIDAQVDQINSMDLPEEEKQKFESMMRKLFNGTEMLEAYENELKKNLSLEELKELNEMQKDPLYEKDREHAAQMQTPEGQREMMKKMMNAQKKPSSKEDLEFAKGYDEATGSSKAMFNLMTKMTDTFSSLDQSGPGAKSEGSQKSPRSNPLADKAMEKKFQEDFRRGIVVTNSHLTKEERARKLKHAQNPISQKVSKAKIDIIGGRVDRIKPEQL